MTHERTGVHRSRVGRRCWAFVGLVALLAAGCGAAAEADPELLTVSLPPEDLVRASVTGFEDPHADWLDTIAAVDAVAVGLPDLISEPPVPKVIDDIEFAGAAMRVVRFDGHVTNIGPGVLDVYGDPALADPDDPTSHDVWQRIWDGDKWTPLAKPPVRFEAADGHDHFHLMQIVRYSLWDAAQANEVAPGEKVGFCLYDSEPLDADAALPAYVINDGYFCRQGAPLADVVRMGISPGWRDLYAADLSLQWIDVSDVVPGTYWLANESDPFDQILEADESNNGLRFSDVAFNLPGYVAEPAEIQASGDSAVTFNLPFTVIGLPTDAPVFEITAVPAGSTVLDASGQEVEIGDRLLDPAVVWQPGSDDDGVLEFAVRTEDSAFPVHPTRAQIVLVAATSDATTAPLALGGQRASLAPGRVMQLATTSSELTDWRVIDDSTGGATVDANGAVRVGDSPGTVLVEAAAAGRRAEVTVSVVVPSNRPPHIDDPVAYLDPDGSDIFGGAESVTTTEVAVGESTVLLLPVLDADGDAVEVSVAGLPDGLTFEPRSSVISGVPTESGSTVVMVRADDGTDDTTHRFELTVTAG